MLVPFINIGNEYHLLLQKRAKSIRQGSEICFPGGKYEPENDADYQATAVRETVEELGINPDCIDVLGRLGTHIAPMGAAVDPFIGRLNIPSLDMLTIDVNDVEKIFSIPFSFFLEQPPEIYAVRLEIQTYYIHKDGEKEVLFPSEELGLPPIYHKPCGGQKHRVFVYRTADGIIWGITAEIVYELVKLFKHCK